MTRRLPPIFAKYRFGIPKAAQPGVLFCVTPEMDREVQHLIDEMHRRDTPCDYFACWWIEYHDMGILAQTVGDTEYRLQWFGRKSGPGVPMDAQPHFWDRDRVAWRSAEGFRRQWLTVPEEYRARMRSMSGWSRVLLGAPEIEGETA